MTDTLTPVSGSGINMSFRDAVQFADKHELVLAIGKYAVLQDIPQQELAFLAGQQRNTSGALGEITAMALCGKRHYLSICRAAVRDDATDSSTSSGAATVSIYSVGAASSSHSSSTSSSSKHASHRTSHDIRKRIGATAALPSESKRSRGVFRTVLRFDTERFCGTALSHDGKLVCAQAANASWTLVVWDWLRSRQVAVVDVHCKVTRVRFNAIDVAQLSTSGGNVLRLWTMAEYTLRVFSSFKSGDETKAKHVAHYVDHVWLPGDCLVALLDDGDVQLIVNAELVQTIRGVHGATKMTCMGALSNGEGVVLGSAHGLVSIVRVGSKMMKGAEKEMQLQRRMRISGAHTIVSVATDPAAATLLCCTESTYGVYDLSDLCFLRGDDEIVALAPVVSTPTSIAMERLSVSSRRPNFAALCTLPSGDHAVHVWNLLDAHKCVVAHSLEDEPPPLCVDIHPSGHELIVSFSSKVHVYVVLQDVLALAFELPQKQLSIVQYSQTGSMFVGVHAANKLVYVYLSYTRHQREPALVGMYRDFRDAITAFMWSLHDSSFFGADAAGELRHCRLRSHCGGEVDDFVVTESRCRVQTPSNSASSSTSTSGGATPTAMFTSLKTWRLDRDSHDFVLFAVEKQQTSTSAVRAKCVIRAWINGDLTRDAIKSSGLSHQHQSQQQLGEIVPHDVTVLGVGCANLLFAGTASGAVVLLPWKLGKRNGEGHLTIRILPHSRRIDLHTAPVCGAFYMKAARTLVTNATNGVVLACTLQQQHHQSLTQDSDASVVDAAAQSTDALRAALSDDDYVDTSTTFASVTQADEVALYNRSKIDLRSLKFMELESELQQLKLENEMLTKQISEQRDAFDDTLKRALSAAAHDADDSQQHLQAEMDARLHGLARDREVRLHELSSDARIAQDQYLQSLEKTQAELAGARRRLQTAEAAMTDAQIAADERESELRRHFEALLEAKTRESTAATRVLETELALTRKQLQEVLRQQDQDQMAHLGMLSATIASEKARAAEQMTSAQGKVAGLNQELKMLLTALNDKDAAIEAITAEQQDAASELRSLQDRLSDERQSLERVVKEKTDVAHALSDLQHAYENLQRLNTVHRSQIELLQKQLGPKDRELAQMQQYLNALHDANQDIVVQANLSDRLRRESAGKATKLERDVGTSQQQLERIRHSIVVLQEELGELVKRSAVQEKSAVVGDVVRIHKRLTRQLEILQARDDSAEEITAELHRQNGFLLKHKQHLRQQMESVSKDKHKLVSALSFQNGTLLAELNALKRQNKELERKAKRLEERVRELQMLRGRSAGESATTSGRPAMSPASSQEPSGSDKAAAVIIDGNQDPRDSFAVLDAPSASLAASATAQTARASAMRSLARPKSAGALSTKHQFASETGRRGRGL